MITEIIDAFFRTPTTGRFAMKKNFVAVEYRYNEMNEMNEWMNESDSIEGNYFPCYKIIMLHGLFALCSNSDFESNALKWIHQQCVG